MAHLGDPRPTMSVVPNTTEVDPTHKGEATRRILHRMKHQPTRIVSRQTVTEETAPRNQESNDEDGCKSRDTERRARPSARENKKGTSVSTLLSRMQALACACRIKDHNDAAL
mmetsp:Transcript_2259/g.15014  ORF Transcript_2259/g.15014 Transcript_2259/m.15014 type:complete len:113 (+) Transcript_2259:876-1214(+)